MSEREVSMVITSASMAAMDSITSLNSLAHVRMDLGFVADSGGAQAEGLGGPLQIVRPGVAAQRQAFAESRLVDLHDPDAGGLQVDHFVADRQGQLARLHLARHVLAREDHISMVTGPVSMPFITLSVRLWAYLIHSTVMARGRLRSP